MLSIDESETHRSIEGEFGSLFEEPEGYFKPTPKPHTEIYHRKNGGIYQTEFSYHIDNADLKKNSHVF
jgi:hypothetical protein